MPAYSLIYLAAKCVKEQIPDYTELTQDAKDLLDIKYQLFIELPSNSNQSYWIKYTGYMYQMNLMYLDIVQRVTNPRNLHSVFIHDIIPDDTQENMHINFSINTEVKRHQLLSTCASMTTSTTTGLS